MNKTSMNRQPQSIQLVLDQQIKAQYHQICFNPKKIDILKRLSEPPDRACAENQNICLGSQQHLNNELVNSYINHVYEKYKIEDPIQKQLRLSNKDIPLDKQPQSKTPQKYTQPYKTINNEQLTTTKKKLNSLKSKYKQDCNEIVYSHPSQNHSRHESQSRMKESKQIGYRTRQKINFKIQTEQSFQASDIRRHTPSMHSKHPNISFRYKNPEVSSFLTHPQIIQIPVVFRYCPMCEEIILQQNIVYHESICRDIQKAYKISNRQLLLIIENKIDRIKKQIQTEFVDRSERQIMNDYLAMRKTVIQYITDRSNQPFSQLQAEMQRFSIDCFDKLKKLNWFKHLKNKIETEMQKEPNI